MASKVIITSRGKLTEDTVAETPVGMPDVLVKPMSILNRLVIKCSKVYLSSLVAFMGTALIIGVPGAQPQQLDSFIAVLVNAAQLAMVPAIGTFILNLTIFVTKLDESTPELVA